ncbi:MULTISPECIES: LysR family transcriptional regulator [Pseudoalteromonas]|jgi:DNA-binding transcriptional LysR family regulator|uniref:LysR family transcriptional regulator n=1 Tax=Pseudoalteromonas neustonica TaxID=1840331 RepID=A0ABY3FCW7_9GAMM|nr:LysR family transcriptional regulator [Pseudoalteromonas neustonica]TVU82900.1 LysR family transcriptional regulator [Pseudoalteromonas neustonica]
MAKIDDMQLFVHVVRSGGLAAAGRKIGLSPASMTARINQLENHYQTRLLIRNTRSIKLTEAGEQFYQGCLRVIAEIDATEQSIQLSKNTLSGSLKITAPSDFGKQFVAPAIAKFVAQNPQVKPHLHLTDGLVNLVEEGIDIAIRFGNLPDSNLISRMIKANQRVLCASAEYLKIHGQPLQPNDLLNHRCLVMERFGQSMHDWHFKDEVIRVPVAMSSSDGAVIRQWAIDGAGVALKSMVDISDDLTKGNLVTILDDYILGFSNKDKQQIGLQFLYPSRQFQPRQVAAFMDFFQQQI